MLYICIVNLRRGMSVHHRRRVADIIKGVYCACFGSLKTGNFRNPKQESGKCPLVCLIRCTSQRWTYRRGHSLFILVTRFSSTSDWRISNSRVPRFFYIYQRGVWSQLPTSELIMKKIYQIPCTVLHRMETTITLWFKRYYFYTSQRFVTVY